MRAQDDGGPLSCIAMCSSMKSMPTGVLELIHAVCESVNATPNALENTENVRTYFRTRKLLLILQTSIQARTLVNRASNQSCAYAFRKPRESVVRRLRG
jgi:hypothetical protein